MTILDLGLTAVWGMLAVMLAGLAGYLVATMPEDTWQQSERILYRVYCWAQNRRA